MTSGCRKTPEELHQRAVEASEAAVTAVQNEDVKRARTSAKRASEYLRQLEVSAANDPSARELVANVRPVVVAAREQAELFDEQHQRQEHLTSLKVRAYGASRDLFVRGICSAAGLGAEAMASGETNRLVTEELDLMFAAHDLAMILGEYDLIEESGLTNWT
jgi:hypothetical protein